MVFVQNHSVRKEAREEAAHPSPSPSSSRYVEKLVLIDIVRRVYDPFHSHVAQFWGGGHSYIAYVNGATLLVVAVP